MPIREYFLYWDGADMTTNTLKAYFKHSCFLFECVFMISKIHRVAQKPYRGQLNTKVCGSNKSVISFFQTTLFNNDNRKVVQVITITSP